MFFSIPAISLLRFLDVQVNSGRPKPSSACQTLLLLCYFIYLSRTIQSVQDTWDIQVQKHIARDLLEKSFFWWWVAIVIEIIAEVQFDNCLFPWLCVALCWGDYRSACCHWQLFSSRLTFWFQTDLLNLLLSHCTCRQCRALAQSPFWGWLVSRCEKTQSHGFSASVSPWNLPLRRRFKEAGRITLTLTEHSWNVSGYAVNEVVVNWHDITWW